MAGIFGSGSLVDDRVARREHCSKLLYAAGKSFRLTGITFKKGSITQVGNGGAIRILSTGLVQSARIDHCHFDHLYWGHSLQIGSWIYGVDDHNLYESNGNNISHLIHHSSWGGSNNGNGSWADYPYYGSEKFWFMEDNTIKGSGSVGTSGGVDCQNGGRYVARHNYFRTPLLEVMAQKAVRYAVSDAIKSITTPFTGQSAMVVTPIVLAAPSGTTTLF